MAVKETDAREEIIIIHFFLNNLDTKRQRDAIGDILGVGIFKMTVHVLNWLLKRVIRTHGAM